MAGLDMMYDACGSIEKYIEEKIRELLEDPMNEYQDPNWVQAALLFERVVVPCGDGYMKDGLLDLAKDIIEKAEQNNNQAIYQVIPGMYNEKIIDPNSIDVNNLPAETEIREYQETINNIKKWIDNFIETLNNIKSWMEGSKSR